MSELVEHEKTVEAPAHVVAPSRHDQAKAARGARLWTWIARLTGLALLAAVLGFGFYLAAANSQARERGTTLLPFLG
jgi:hypothetical protein